jgi:hypothetical protein
MKESMSLPKTSTHSPCLALAILNTMRATDLLEFTNWDKDCRVIRGP